MRELTGQEILMVSGGSCSDVAGNTFGGAIVTGFGMGARAGALGGIKGAALGAGIGAVGGAAAYGFCSMLAS